MKAMELVERESTRSLGHRRHLNVRRHVDHELQRAAVSVEATDLPVKPVVHFSVVEGRLKGSTLVVSEGFLTIGRNSSPPWNLGGDRSISRVHARVVLGNERCTIEDLISDAGTFVNGVMTAGPFALEEWDEIEIGSTRLKVVRLVTPGSGWKQGLRPSKGSHRVRNMILAGVSAALVIGLLAFVSISASSKAGRSGAPARTQRHGDVTVAIPTLVGKDNAEAYSTLVDSGLVYRQVNRPSDTKAFGMVISSVPSALETVKSGSTVSVFVSCGDASLFCH